MCTTKEYTRQVDWVVFPGNPEPLKLFTIDVNVDAIEMEKFQYMTSKEKKIKRVRDRMERNNLRSKGGDGTIDLAGYLAAVLGRTGRRAIMAVV